MLNQGRQKGGTNVNRLCGVIALLCRSKRCCCSHRLASDSDWGGDRMCARVRASVCVCLCVCVSLSLSLCMCVSVFVHVCCHKTKGRESTAYFRRIAGASHSLTMSTSVTAMIRSKSAASKLSCSGEALNTTSMPRSRSLSRTAATASTACHAQRERECVCVCVCACGVCVSV